MKQKNQIINKFWLKQIKYLKRNNQFDIFPTICNNKNRSLL